MKTIICVIILFFLTASLSSQETLKVGDKAPTIIITDYILNVPKSKSLENKFIILEFWASWCAPCLGSVPHLNDLQNKFKNRKDLIFLSMTSEKPEKIKRTLEKIEFKTNVVSDTSKKTETIFNVQGIPHTVLIDNKGVVKWIGRPFDLNSALIDKFLAGQAISSKNIESAIEKLDTVVVEKKESESNSDIAFKIFKDKNIKYTYSLINAGMNETGMAMKALSMGIYIDLNSSLKSIISNVTKEPESQIVIPEELSENKYNIIYKNTNNVGLEANTVILKNNVLNSTNLAETIKVKNVIAYNLKVKDPKKIDISINQDEENHSGGNETHFIFSNSPIETFINKIENYYKIIIVNNTELTKNIDFIIRKSDLNDLMKDLEEYGFTLEKFSKETEFYIYK